MLKRICWEIRNIMEYFSYMRNCSLRSLGVFKQFEGTRKASRRDKEHHSPKAAQTLFVIYLRDSIALLRMEVIF